VKKTRILILDDHTILRQGVAGLLNAEPDMEMKLGCGSVGEALLIVAAGLVDVVLLDLDLGTERGTDFLAQARRNGFKGPVLVLTAGVTQEEEALLEQLGVSEILKKDSSVNQLAERVREAAGGSSLQPTVRQTPAVGLPNVGARPFTQREAATLRLVVEGLANKEIAGELDCSEAVVKGLMQQLFRKTGTHTRSQLVRVALEYHRELL
jgi:two-component system nitrate/nitrite response regulator NarL